MTNQKSPRWLGRTMAAIRSALGRAILGKSSHAYMRQFGATDEWWDNVLAANRRCHEEQRCTIAPDCALYSSGTATPTAGIASDAGRDSPASEYEPVHGLTGRQLADYLRRNPDYRPGYEAALRRRSGAAPEVDGPQTLPTSPKVPQP
jgi:hypothetical protein